MTGSFLKRYSLGLDIGIASIGWAVLDLEREKIADLGVRLFERAENPKDGSSLAAPRREARSTRRRLRRKRGRLSDVRKLIVSYGLLSQDKMDRLFDIPQSVTPWELRSEGLDRRLTENEWARVLIHIAKHRGFKSNRMSAENSENNSEDGKALAGVNENSRLLKEGEAGIRYRTVGEMIQKADKFAAHKRNKGGKYTHTVLRADIEEEIKELFSHQRDFGNSFTSNEFEREYTKIFSRQLPFASGTMIEKLVGKCSLEPDEIRAPRASHSAERFILLSKIANLRVWRDGEKTPLTIEEKRKVSDLAYKNVKVTFKQIRKALGWSEFVSFDSLPPAKKDQDAEEKTFVELKGRHALKKQITEKLGKDYWERLVYSPTILDDISCGLTFRKTDDDIKEYLRECGIAKELIEAVLPLNFSGVTNLSLKATRKLLEYMELDRDACNYYEACVKAGYGEEKEEENRSLILPVPDWETIRNPVVIRAIAETRKVVNAIVRRYGSPESIQIELARDLSRSKKERDEISKEQEGNRTRNEHLKEDYKNLFGYEPNGRRLEKYRLWKEQNGICMYTGEYMEPNEVFKGDDDSYAEIDHIVPYSISFDDSQTNKVLVLARANRDKKNRIPYSYIGEKLWDEYTARVDANIKNSKKAARLKIKSLSESGAEEMKERSLNDTRYITKYVANWLETKLIFSGEEKIGHVTRINGRATAIMRRKWGVNKLKNRGESDLHHALDACVIAAATPSIIQKISLYSKYRELGKRNENNEKYKFPEPWRDFRLEIEARISDDPAENIRIFGLKNYSEDELKELRPIFVSQRPERGATGAAHDETIRSAKYLDEENPRTAVKRALTSLSAKDLENMVGKERDRLLYEALRKRLEEFGGKGAKAFKEEFRKPTRDGSLGPVVRSIKVFDSGTSGVKVNNGIAFNGGMVRVDVYQKSGKYFLVPYYISDIAKRIKKDRAIVAGKKEEDWVVIDKSYNFLFSIFKFDLIKVVDSKGVTKFGYYDGCNRSTGAFDIISPYGKRNGDKREKWESIGIRTAKSVEKYQVDVLGEYHKVKKEKPPYGLA